MCRNVLDLLLDANEADLLIVEHQDDDRQVLALGSLQIRDHHREAAIAGERHDRAIRIGDTGRERAGGAQCMILLNARFC